MKNWNIT